MPSCIRHTFSMLKLKGKNVGKWNKINWFQESFHAGTSEVVEEIMSKEIFNDDDLEKITPDYNPSDLVHRMEVRSYMVRDNHSHSARRKKIVKSKFQRDRTVQDISRVTRELTKVKSNLNSNMVKNKIMMKHTTKNNKIKPIIKKQKHGEEADTTFIDNEISFISEMDNNLNSERELLSEITSHRPNETDKTKELKEVKNSDDIQDLQSAITLMTLYSRDENFTSKDPAHINIPNNESIKDVVHESFELKAIRSDTEDNAHKLSECKNMDEEFLTINSLSNIAKQKHVAKKFFSKWRHYVNTKKGMSELRKKTLNEFFDKLMQEKIKLINGNVQNCSNLPKNKAELIARDQTHYQHRFQVQKNIIALQKLKLEEQSRFIEELKYNKIIEASKDSAESMREALRNSYTDMDRRMKPTIKCLTNELKLRDIEEPALVLHCLKVPQFLQRMERRAREREEKHAMIRERRRQIEEERLRLKQQAELAKAEMDKEEKEKRMKELKEKRKQEKIESIRRKQHTERMRALAVMADLHYERNLILRCGFRPWMKLVMMQKQNEVKAHQHYEMLVKRNAFLHWMWHTEDMVMERNYKAEQFYRIKLLKQAVNAFKMNHRALVLKQQVADDYYDLYVQQIVFRKFRANVAIVKREQELKLQKGIKYYESNLKFRILTHWRVLPALNRLQRERDARKSRWRKKVLQVVPDYQPPDVF